MRRAGLLVHPTALPGPGPSGDLGEGTLSFLDWLADCGIGLWQVLPLCPVGGGFSPYDSPSAFAGGAHLLSVQSLAEDGLLSARDAVAPPSAPHRVDRGLVQRWHRPRIERAAQVLAKEDPAAIEAFAAANPWAADWGLYQALLAHHGVDAWQALPPALAAREPDALARAREALADRIAMELGLQVLFRRQWDRVRTHAASRGVRILGDVPIFLSGGACDVWAGRHRFQGSPDPTGLWQPDPVAGVPPDYFSPEGQLWGNPHYDWPVHEAEGFSWWTARLASLFELVDEVRIDHFRGLVAAWEVERGAENAMGGRWAPGPGRQLFDAIARDLGDAPILVEDLGEITDDVHALRDDLGLPGMKILQFAFDGNPNHPFKPHTWTHPRWVAYTGTHDNNTSLGWYAEADEVTRHRFRVYVARSGDEAHWDLLRLAWSSTAETAVTQLQDVLGLGSEARFNTPGTVEGNWLWRTPQLPDRFASARLRETTALYGRTKSEVS